MVRSCASAARMRGDPRIASQAAATTSASTTAPNANSDPGERGDLPGLRAARRQHGLNVGAAAGEKQ